MKLLIDTNVWLRYVVGDDELTLKACKRLIEIIEEGRIRPYVSSIILLEIYFVLRSVYAIRYKEAQTDINAIVSTRGIVIIEKTNFRHAFALHRQTGIKLADCLIATQIPKGVTLCTYDKEFEKIPTLQLSTPEQVLKISI